MNFAVKRVGPPGSRFVIFLNPLYETAEIEGAKPVLIVPNTAWFASSKGVQRLKRLLSKMPFLSPMSLMSHDELDAYESVFENESFVLLKQLQKLSCLLIEPAKQRRSPNLNSAARLLASMDLKTITDAKGVNEAIVQLLNSFAHKTLGEWRLPKDNPLLPKMNSAFFSLTLADERTSEIELGTPFRLEPSALFFWARVCPGVLEGKSAPLAGEPAIIEKLARQNVAAEYLIQLTESRFDAAPAEWIRREFEEPASEPSNKLTASPVAAEPYCIRPFEQMRITCEGDVFMCCWQDRPHMAIGNLLKSSTEEVWNSPLVTQTRDSILKGKFPKICQATEGCPYAFSEKLPSPSFTTPSHPHQIDINLPNSHCNIGGRRPTAEKPACIMCERNREGYRFQDEENFELVLEKASNLIPHLRNLHIQGVAEPFWNDAIFKVLDKVNFDDYRDKVYVSTVTNGTIFDARRQKMILERCPKILVSFSLDASSPESYRTIRRLNAFDVLLKNVRSFGEMRRNYNGAAFRIQNNINLMNIDDVEGMVRFAAEVGVDEIELNPTGGGFDFCVNPTNAHLFAEAERKARAEADRSRVRLVILRPLDMGYSTQAVAESV